MATPQPLSCLVVVPLLNEQDYLPAFLASMDGQSQRPDRLVLVDDGSSDRSPELCEAFARDRAWAQVLYRPPRATGKDRLLAAPELAAFLWALEQVAVVEDVIVKMDADLRLAPEHFETVLGAMEHDPELGIAGTWLVARLPDGSEKLEAHASQHVRGPTKFYRHACFDEISPIPQLTAWDGADEIRARARGWRTGSIPLPGAPTLHLRQTGGHDGRVRAFARWGSNAYALGAHPAAVLAGAVLKLPQRPRVLGALAYLWGWAAAMGRRDPRVAEDIRRAGRREQRKLLLSGRRTLPDAPAKRSPA